jgi:hypothetical protein
MVLGSSDRPMAGSVMTTPQGRLGLIDWDRF